jgi:hypothetical protein
VSISASVVDPNDPNMSETESEAESKHDQIGENPNSKKSLGSARLITGTGTDTCQYRYSTDTYQ